MAKRLTTEQYKEKLKLENSSLELMSDYNGNKNFINVRCIKHNYIFRTKPNLIHRGCGCKKCYDERRGKTLRKTKEKFFEELANIYKNKNYDFSKVEYKNSNTKVTIICKKHGEFFITPNHIITNHRGCPKCALEQNGKSKRLTTEQFIEKAKNIHGYRYDYSKVNYVKTNKKVIIICPKHGDFEQTPSTHLNGCGCPYCKESNLEKKIKNWLQVNNIEFEYQKRFSWLGLQSLDFYLPKYSIAIECQGRQHFIPIEFFGGDEEYKNRIKLDINKFTLCTNKNVKIFYVVEQNFNENTNKLEYRNIYNKKLFKINNFFNLIKEKYK